MSRNAAMSQSFTQDHPRLREIRGNKKKYREQFNISIKAQTDAQKTYLSNIFNSDQCISIGCAGTGKTYIATAAACQMLHNNRISRIVLTRPNVTASKSIGFFPGTLQEKMAPWTVPFTDTMVKLLGKGVVDTGMKNGAIEIIPFETMRGRTFDDSFVIVDEAQNCTLNELKMLVTRMGRDSKLIINGDTSQTDIGNSGLSKLIDIAERNGIDIPVVCFTGDDVVRSGICGEWVRAFDREG